jgi:PLP dependent protein
MHSSVQNLNLIKNKIKDIIDKKQLKTNPEIVAVTKTFSLDKIIPLLEEGHIHFGENKIQEAEEKWGSVRKKFTKVNLHMIGRIQSNKAKKAVQLFDYIHSLDSLKLAKKISQYENELNKKIKLFIQVNIADETQKAGIHMKDLRDFYNYCFTDLSLDIVGLMCLPPIDTDPNNYFKILNEKKIEFNLPDLSIGMSFDYEKALLNDATYLRLGSAIFGKRSN